MLILLAFMLKYDGKRFKTFRDGLRNKRIWCLAVLGKDTLLLGTENGIRKFHKEKFVPCKLAKVIGDEGNLHATLKDSKGKIYFGIAPGLVEISPQVKSTRIPPPSLFIKNVTVNSSAQPLKGSLELKHNQNNIEFFYIAVSTRKENPVFYRTRLSPFDQKWSHAVRDTQIKYLNLPPGDYSFEVEANNTGGQQQWIKSKNKITFSIEKPFWHGHKAGDIVIVEIARLLLEMLRNSDTIVRWGGEEFLIITRQTAAHFPFIPGDIETIKPLDIDTKEIVSDIQFGLDKKYIELVSVKKNLKIPQLKM
ncbi:MAG: diguanylate cyclase [bacterium]|nr:diguanylate cyclase [bacterium]